MAFVKKLSKYYDELIKKDLGSVDLIFLFKKVNERDDLGELQILILTTIKELLIKKLLSQISLLDKQSLKITNKYDGWRDSLVGIDKKIVEENEDKITKYTDILTEVRDKKFIPSKLYYKKYEDYIKLSIDIITKEIEKVNLNTKEEIKKEKKEIKEDKKEIKKKEIKKKEIKKEEIKKEKKEIKKDKGEQGLLKELKQQLSGTSEKLERKYEKIELMIELLNKELK